MSLAGALFLLMMGLRQVANVPEPAEMRQARLYEIAATLASESALVAPEMGWPVDAVAAFGWTLGKWEGWLYRPEVALGTMRGPSGEVCFFQIQRGAYQIPARWRPEPLELLTGSTSESLTACVRSGLRLVSYHRARCARFTREPTRIAAEVLFGQYHLPTSSCVSFSPLAPARANDYEVALYRLRVLLKTQTTSQKETPAFNRGFRALSSRVERGRGSAVNGDGSALPLSSREQSQFAMISTP